MSTIPTWIRFPLLLGAALLALVSERTLAEGWSATLQGGGQVTVDPSTNRATIRKDGVQTQIWDGVHRLDDGSIITIHLGQVVPNQEILRARRQPRPADTPEAGQWQGIPLVGSSPCERLVQRVCGGDQGCADQPACFPARQLLEMENRERAASNSPNYMTYSSGQCQEAERDRVYFASCGQAPAAASIPPSACRLLVDKVCGVEGACSGRTACDAAQQLLRMAQRAGRQAQAAVPQQNPEDYQCREALGDDGFFQRCRY